MSSSQEMLVVVDIIVFPHTGPVRTETASFWWSEFLEGEWTTTWITMILRIPEMQETGQEHLLLSEYDFEVARRSPWSCFAFSPNQHLFYSGGQPALVPYLDFLSVPTLRRHIAWQMFVLVTTWRKAFKELVFYLTSCERSYIVRQWKWILRRVNDLAELTGLPDRVYFRFTSAERGLEVTKFCGPGAVQRDYRWRRSIFEGSEADSDRSSASS